MSTQAALPSYVREDDGSILTFIVPAPEGCDLACPFCYIKQRGEHDASSNLSPEDYGSFIKQVAERNHVAAVCIQGYEPLLESSFPYTRAILATGRWLGLKTSLITNGTHLEQWVDALAVLSPDRISVSLDAAAADEHDRQRGKAGAFDSAVSGLKQAVAKFPSATETAVTSVLLPKRRSQLEGMPSLLAKLGIKRWVVTALLKVGKDTIGGPVGERARIFRDLKLLQEEAHRHGIEFVADDEFGGLTELCDDETAKVLRIKRLLRPGHIYRLAPDGQCSRGTDLLRELRDDTACWQPGKMHAGDFIEGLSAAELAYVLPTSHYPDTKMIVARGDTPK